jgi:hypothetical protein
MHKLTVTEVRNIKPTTKPIKLSDGGGLYLHITPSGSKYWRYDYRYGGKRKTIAFGVHPDVTLKQARVRHFEARSQLDQGIDPAELKKVEKLTRGITTANSFEALAVEWIETKCRQQSDGRLGRITTLFPP